MQHLISPTWYCPTDEMLGDFIKPLQGEKFRKFRDWIQGKQD